MPCNIDSNAQTIFRRLIARNWKIRRNHKDKDVDSVLNMFNAYTTRSSIAHSTAEV